MRSLGPARPHVPVWPGTDLTLSRPQFAHGYQDRGWAGARSSSQTRSALALSQVAMSNSPQRECADPERPSPQTGTQRASHAVSSLSPWCPQRPVQGPAWKGHRCLLMECPREDSVSQVPERVPPALHLRISLTHGNSILCKSRVRKTPSDACTDAQPGTQLPRRSLCVPSRGALS